MAATFTPAHSISAVGPDAIATDEQTAYMSAPQHKIQKQAASRSDSTFPSINTAEILHDDHIARHLLVRQSSWPSCHSY